MNKLIRVLVISYVSVFFAGCATSVPVTLTRPAELDLHGAKTIAVLPFQNSMQPDFNQNGAGTTIVINIKGFFNGMKGADPDEIATANYLTSELMQRLSNSDHIQLINSSVVHRALEDSSTVPVDVYLTGKIMHFDSRIDKRVATVEKDDKTYFVDYFSRNVSVSIMYQIIDAKTNHVIAYKTKKIDRRSGDIKDDKLLESAYSIIKPALNSLVRQIMKQLQPYEEVKYISLLSDKTKNPDMKAADELVKNGLISQGRERFMTIYKSINDFTAGYNAAKLLQAEGNLEDSETLMTELVTKFGDKRAVKALNDIEYEIIQAEKLKKQTDAQISQ